MKNLSKFSLLAAAVIGLSACASSQPEPVVEEPVVIEPAQPEPVVEPAPEPVVEAAPAPSANIEFAFDSSKIGPGEQSDLQQWASYIQEGAYNRVEVHGHADDTGSADYNRKLSADRANSTVQALRNLVSGQVDFVVVPHGEEQPLAENSDEQGRQLNRRVEIVPQGASL
ncbi:Outer membrane protein and related peptidoglycan-associated (lipo)protein [Hahella chejuensis KCTC 2396]|uniref:Outer membrane protein and related peptidoglycan-associated (Lipo)protein n=1 Tax=Hahella chejuensis (strain KCTC 2396) TaxID=349521 RepID=Q2SM31_HAHCH|nr:OmpA family protein [Hahella chejuensis]ABC28293.1 Outer membrane protein and related peptidoglycan-associated (lipo)protein [Hahella chejuensis KCTC 2396]